MATRSIVLGVLAFFLVSATATADPHNYVQAGLGDVLVVCVNFSAGGTTYSGVGGACGLPAGHVKPNYFGRATLSIADFSNNPTSGFYCQDPNEDALCGGPNEPNVGFCGAITIDRDVNWDPGLTIQIKVHGPIFGSPLLTTCGLPNTVNNPSFGTIGSVTHS